MVEKIFCSGSLFPMMLSKLNRSWICDRSASFSLPQPLLLERGVQHARHLRERKRLDQEIDGAALDRVDRVGDAAKAGDHDGANLRVERQRLVQHVHAVRVGQPQVDDHRVVGEAAQPFDGVLAVGCLGDGKPVGLQRLGHQRQ